MIKAIYHLPLIDEIRIMYGERITENGCHHE